MKNERAYIESMRLTERILDQYDRKLGDFFSSSSNFLAKMFCNNFDEEHNDIWINERGLNIISADQIGLFPTVSEDLQFSCSEICVGFAKGKWNNKDRRGFQKLTRSLQKYWSLCPDDNRVTLIYTSAWDEKDFYSDYSDLFSMYCSHQKKLAVVHATRMGFSVQYLG